MTRLNLSKLIFSLLIICPSAWAQGGGDVASANTPGRTTRRQLLGTYREGFQPPDEDKQQAKRMQALIDKINAMSLKPKPVKKPAAARPKKPEQKKPTAEKPTRKSVLSEKTLKQLRNTVPQSVADPTKLADALFSSGYRKEAFVFYESSLAQADRPEDRGWMLYQMAGCHMNSDSAKAIKYFQQLLAEYPDSLWSPAAKAQLELMKQMQEYKPREFLKKVYEDLDEKVENPAQALPPSGGQKTKSGSGQGQPPAATTKTSTPAGKANTKKKPTSLPATGQSTGKDS